MSRLNFVSLLIFVIIFAITKNCDSSSYAVPSNHLLTSPPYGSVASELPSNLSATPFDLPAPGPDPFPEIAAFPPAPELVPVPAPDAYPPTSGLSPISNPPEPISWAPYPSASPVHISREIKAAYWPSFTDFPASSIDTSYFTHIYYAFLLPEPDTFKLNVTAFDLTKIPELIDTLRAQNVSIKILLSIGGGGNDPNVFSKMASTRKTRATFINSTIEIAGKYGFDGVDLDWEFPANDQDMSNLGLLFKQWRRALNYEARTSGSPRLLFTSAVYFASKFMFGEPRSYPADAIKKFVDWVSPMCFDYHGSWENFTGVHAALYDPNSNISTSFGIGSWIEAGVPPKKLVMGLPVYGRTWKLEDPNVNGIGAPALGVGPGHGILTYDQIVNFNTANNSFVKFDDETVAYYSYAGDSWIGYDDVKSVKRKVRFAKSRGLSGYFFWALGQDKNWTISRLASNSWGR